MISEFLVNSLKSNGISTVSQCRWLIRWRTWVQASQQVKCSECSSSFFSSELQKVLCRSSSMICSVCVLECGYCNGCLDLCQAFKLCLSCASWLRKSFSVCPIEISHLFKISDSKNVLLCLSFSTLTVTSFHVFSWLFVGCVFICLVLF